MSATSTRRIQKVNSFWPACPPFARAHPPFVLSWPLQELGDILKATDLDGITLETQDDDILQWTAFLTGPVSFMASPLRTRLTLTSSPFVPFRAHHLTREEPSSSWSPSLQSIPSKVRPPPFTSSLRSQLTFLLSSRLLSTHRSSLPISLLLGRSGRL